VTKGIEQSVDVPFPHIESVEISLPPVSVIICNYNQGRFVKDAILSVFRQHYSNFECAVVDDKSADDSVALIRAVLEELNDPRFRFIERNRNGGQMAAMLTGFDGTSAPFVAFLDADDVWLPTFLETHIGFHLSSDINAALSCSNFAIIDSNRVLLAGTSMHGIPLADQRAASLLKEGRQIRVRKLRRDAPQVQFNGNQEAFFIKNSRFDWVWTATSAMMFRRTTLEAIRPKDPSNYPICADFYLATFAQIVGGSILSYGVHGYYRIHEANYYSKIAVLGHGTIAGTMPASVLAATHRGIIEMLSTDEFLKVVIPADHKAAVVSFLAKGQAQWILRQAKLKPHIPRSLKIKMQLRCIGRAIKLLLKKPGQRVTGDPCLTAN
jgi:glycosyltransferase involved in cell wall biosynthesis